MSYLKLILFIVLYYASILIIGKLVSTQGKLNIYKSNILIGIFSIIISLILIYFSDIDFKEAGFKIGNIKKRSNNDRNFIFNNPYINLQHEKNELF